MNDFTYFEEVFQDSTRGNIIFTEHVFIMSGSNEISEGPSARDFNLSICDILCLHTDLPLKDITLFNIYKSKHNFPANKWNFSGFFSYVLKINIQ